MHLRLFLAGALLALGVPALALAQVETRPPEVPTQKPAFAGQTRAPAVTSKTAYDMSTLAVGLDHPWSMAFIDKMTLLVTERAGRLRILTLDGKLGAPITGLPELATSPAIVTSKDGLYGVAVSPTFASDRTLFIAYLAKGATEGQVRLAIARGRLSPDKTALSDVKTIFTTEPGREKPADVGGRMVFSRDGTLFISLGDHPVMIDKAQDFDNDLGKVVRINADGSIPKDNPFVGKPGARPEIWSLGHRNVLGLAINPADGRVWESENGPRGGDEINLEAPGRNYGWPVITYGEGYDGKPIHDGLTAKDGMEQPLYYWDPAIAPSGITFYTGRLFPEWRGNLFVAALKAKHVVRLVTSGTRIVGEERLFTDLGARIRDVIQGPDGALYIATDEDAGRVIRITPKK